MDTQNTLDSIPIDLFNEIFSRLPIKTVGRCRCVSSILASRLGTEDFKELFFTRSLTRPRFLFVRRLCYPSKEDYDVFYSSPQPQNPYEKSSLVVRADFHTKFPRHYFRYASGLFHFPELCISTTKVRVICNPITGQYVILPKLRTDKEPISFLGFDPIDKQFKLLLINAQVNNERIHFILTLGTGKMKWRTIQCPLLYDYDCPFSWTGICINGILYYLAQHTGLRSYMIVCFDVGTETFKFKPIAIDVPGYISSRRLIKYKGKLAIIILRKLFRNPNPVKLYMLVLEDEDVKQQEWSKYTLRLPSKVEFELVGMTSTNEIVLSTRTKTSQLFNVYYFNPERNSLERVEVQGIETLGDFYVFMDYVEDLYVNDAKYFKSNIHAHLPQGRFVSTNAFEALSLSEEEDDDFYVIF